MDASDSSDEDELCVRLATAECAPEAPRRTDARLLVVPLSFAHHGVGPSSNQVWVISATKVSKLSAG